MQVYYDSEFLEGTQTKRFLGIPYGKTKPTIDLISIGLVSEDNREYYAVSRDFNLKEAWNRYDLKKEYPDDTEEGAVSRKVYWIRENVLRPVFDEWQQEMNGKIVRLGLPVALNQLKFNYKNFKYCIQCIGKSNKQIAEEIKEFVYKPYGVPNSDLHVFRESELLLHPIEFYGYYSAYDHVALCWLFGKMIDLPKGFPMHTRDLKQILDEKTTLKRSTWGDLAATFDMLSHIKTLPDFPQNPKVHHALLDAKWNKKLHEFLNRL